MLRVSEMLVLFLTFLDHAARLLSIGRLSIQIRTGLKVFIKLENIKSYRPISICNYTKIKYIYINILVSCENDF